MSLPQSRGSIDTNDLIAKFGQATVLKMYEDVQQLRVGITSLSSKIDALAQAGNVEDLTKRVNALELAQATTLGRNSVWDKTFNLMWGLLLTLIAAGVWLPKLL